MPDELSFYRRRNIPLPRECPNCRYYRRLTYRNPSALRTTVCMCSGEESSNGKYKNTVLHDHGSSACGKSMDTTIESDSDCIIYCEKCYQKEVF